MHSVLQGPLPSALMVARQKHLGCHVMANTVMCCTVIKWEAKQASVKQHIAGNTSRVSCMQFADGSFTAIVDKGGLDALMGEDTEGANAAGGELLAEVTRLLEPRRGSLYLCVTLAQSHVLSTPYLISAPESV